MSDRNGVKIDEKKCFVCGSLDVHNRTVFQHHMTGRWMFKEIIIICEDPNCAQVLEQRRRRMYWRRGRVIIEL